MSSDKKPASLFDNELDSMKSEDWSRISNSRNRDNVDTDTVREVAENAGFTSREPVSQANSKKISVPAANRKLGRPRKKEATDQINFRAKISTIDEFREFSGRQEPEWPLGYTLERALAALKREIEI